MTTKSSKTPKVSIVAVSFNQERYIRQALDSFVAQQTKFDYEIVIADDASTDATPQIIQEYTEQFPKLFRPILRKKNIGIAPNFIDAMRSAQGEYIALCEGDDFWTDVNKLQFQADYLDTHSDYALVFHPVQIFYESGGEESIYPDNSTTRVFDLPHLLENNFIQTNSVMYRRQKYTDLPTDILPLDWFLHVYHARFGNIGFIDKVMAAYRKHAQGVWWEATHNIDTIWKKYGTQHVGLFYEMRRLFTDKPEYQALIDLSLISMYATFNGIKDSGVREDIIVHAVTKYPTSILPYLSDIRSEKDNLIAHSDKQAEIIGHLERQAQHLTHDKEVLMDRIYIIESSRGFRVEKAIRKKLKRT